MFTYVCKQAYQPTNQHTCTCTQRVPFPIVVVLDVDVCATNNSHKKTTKLWPRNDEKTNNERTSIY